MADATGKSTTRRASFMIKDILTPDVLSSCPVSSPPPMMSPTSHVTTFCLPPLALGLLQKSTPGGSVLDSVPFGVGAQCFYSGRQMALTVLDALRLSASHVPFGVPLSADVGACAAHGCRRDIYASGHFSTANANVSERKANEAVPVPLPVYVRTRSPPCLDIGSKTRRCRRSRTVFTELQLTGLEKMFGSHKYLSSGDRSALAGSLGLTQIQVKTWYQNRRMKWKKQVLLGGGKESPTKPKGRPRKNVIFLTSPVQHPARPDDPKLLAATR